MAWLRSQLRRDAAGILACPDDQRGLDSLTLSEGNAAAASRRQLGLHADYADGGIETPNAVPFPGFVDPNGIPLNPVNQGPTGPLSVIVDMWLRADTVDVAGGVVTRWTDLSNRSNHCFPSGNSSAPTMQSDTDGLPMVSFNGTHWLNGSNSMSARPQWVWAVMMLPSVAGTVYPLRANPGIQAVITPALKVVGGTTAVGAVFLSAGEWGRVIARGDLNDTINVIQFKESSSSGGAIGNIPGSRVTIGAANASGVGAAVVKFKEILIASGVPTAAEINAIEAYGVARYGGGYFA